jgi:hypothetical protein
VGGMPWDEGWANSSGGDNSLVSLREQGQGAAIELTK